MPQLTVPYNGSMRLGQGFDSFMHKTCTDKAVEFGSTSISNASLNPQEWPQTVAVSSGFATTFSDVCNALNLSAASCIKTGNLSNDSGDMSMDVEKVIDCGLILQYSAYFSPTEPYAGYFPTDQRVRYYLHRKGSGHEPNDNYLR
jgi:hypothetical protein